MHIIFCKKTPCNLKISGPISSEVQFFKNINNSVGSGKELKIGKGRKA